MKKYSFVCFFLITLLGVSCDAIFPPEENPSTDPIGGETNLEYTEVGTQYLLGWNFGVSDWEVDGIKDSIMVTENNNGIVTFEGFVSASEAQIKKLDTVFGLQSIPENLKREAIDNMLQKYDASIDSTDRNKIKLNFKFKARLTSEGIQDFKYSGGDENKPFTIVRYDCKVGDKYETTDLEGNKVVREVVSKAEEEDWGYGFMLIKSIKVEEKPTDNPLIEKITYVANHKFGFVGMLIKYKTGKEIRMGTFDYKP